MKNKIEALRRYRLNEMGMEEIISGGWISRDDVLAILETTPPSDKIDTIPLLSIERFQDTNYAVFCKGVEGAVAIGITPEDAIQELVVKAMIGTSWIKNER